VIVDADPQRLTQAVLNLLHNAALHTRPGSPVTLRVQEEPAAWRFEVADEGGGLPRGEEEVVFQPFHRATSLGPGSGLGLAIVRTIAEAHGGSAGVDNRSGEGATFWLRVPR
jgi:signal transduction histidine kinase